jgi:transcriptional regulator with XRE-family HTH domain
MRTRTIRRTADQDRTLTRDVGNRILAARKRAGLTQTQLAGGRYTKAFISALEHGISNPSLEALTFLSQQLQVPVTELLGERAPAWSRVEADLLLASGDWLKAADAYRGLLDDEAQPLRRAELERGLAEALVRLERPDEAIAVASSAAAAFDAAGAAEDAAMARYWLAGAFYAKDNEDEAASIDRALLDGVRAGLKVEAHWEVRLLIALAAIEHRRGEETRALGYLEEARAKVADVDDRRRGAFLATLAATYRERGDLEAAVRLADQAIARFREAMLEREVALLENDLALSYMAMGSIARAREHAAAADAALRATGDERDRAHVVETVAQIALAAGELEEAERTAAAALALATDTVNHKAAISAALTSARVARARGDLSLAGQRMETAAGLAREHARPQQQGDILTEWSEILAELGDVAGAYRLSREALEVVRH